MVFLVVLEEPMIDLNSFSYERPNPLFDYFRIPVDSNLA